MHKKKGDPQKKPDHHRHASRARRLPRVHTYILLPPLGTAVAVAVAVAVAAADFGIAVESDRATGYFM